MSASAGRVLVIHKGEYDATATYSPMDEVFYQGSTYRCKQASTGNLPTNTTYWQLVAAKGEDTVAGNITFDNTDTNLTSDNLQDVVVEVNEKADTKASIDLLKNTVGWTGKNLFDNKLITQTYNGVVWTINSDKSISTSGTTSADNRITLNGSFYLAPGTYILSGCPKSIRQYDYRLRLSVLDDSKIIWQDGWSDNGEVEFTVDSGAYYLMQIKYNINADMSNVLFYPMIRRADIIDDTYEPYHESVETMYEEEIHGVNLLKVTANTQTKNGITFTVNSDNSVKVNGTATAQTFFTYTADYNDLEEGASYIVSGCPLGGTWNTYVLYVPIADATDFGNGLQFTYSKSVATDNKVYIVIASGATVNNLIFKPMLRKATIEDSTYRPYNEQAIQNQINDKGILGAKNLLKNMNSTMTRNGITATYNSDGSILLNGTATADVGFTISKDVSNNNFLPNGKYILSGSTVFSNNCFLWINKYVSGSGSPLVQLKTSGEVEFAIDTSQYDGIKAGITIRNGTTVSNFLVKPMIRLASDPDDTYVPYAMTNRELTEAVSYNKYSVTLDADVTGTARALLYMQVGNIVRIHINITNISYSYSNDYNTLFTLPTGARPREEVLKTVLTNQNMGEISRGFFRIKASGEVQYCPYTRVGTSIYIDETFLI